MFETSMVLTQARPARGRVGLLTASLIAHSAAIVGAVALSVASVDFPKSAPKETAILITVQPPPPLGNPNGGAPPKPAAAPPVQKQQTPPPPTQVTAPPVVPDDVPPVDAPPSSSDSSLPGPATPGTVEGPIGVPWGTEHSDGPLDAPPSPIAAPPVKEQIYTIGGEVKSPVLIHRVDPVYPEIMRKTRMTTTVALKCVIDKNGRVRDLEIVAGAMAPFNDAVMNAVRQWRYQPGSMRGVAVETYLDVKVTFSIH